MENNKKKIKIRYIFGVIILAFFIRVVLINVPEGTSFKGRERNNSSAEFIYDLTYVKEGKVIQEHNIFNEQLSLIEEAEEFIILDMFLFNDDYKRNSNVIYPDISKQLTNKLIEKKKETPGINILFITDEINNFYGSYESEYIRRLKENNIDVVITNLDKIRDSNPLYSGIWRGVFKWFGTSGKGWLTNPFSSDSPKVTARSYMKLLNFKANHRKVIASEKKAIVTSMNPHDASGNHSNIAFKLEGEIIEDIVNSELNIAKMSGYENGQYFNTSYIKPGNNSTNNVVSLITEGKIRDSIINELRKTDRGSEVNIAMFYLSHRQIIKELIDAYNRGVDLKIILDPNKDAFGIKKNGIPNRQVAYEIQRKVKDGDVVRWYDTQGEQFHTKLIMIKNQEKSIIIGGSANFTRRNLDDYNLESNIIIETPKGSILDRDISGYFSRIWDNKDGNYTTDYKAYESKSVLKTIIYRFQELSGLSSF